MTSRIRLYQGVLRDWIEVLQLAGGPHLARVRLEEVLAWFRLHLPDNLTSEEKQEVDKVVASLQALWPDSSGQMPEPDPFPALAPEKGLVFPDVLKLVLDAPGPLSARRAIEAEKERLQKLRLTCAPAFQAVVEQRLREVDILEATLPAETLSNILTPSREAEGVLPPEGEWVRQRIEKAFTEKPRRAERAAHSHRAGTSIPATRPQERASATPETIPRKEQAIRFLGRGVSGWLHDEEGDPEKLRAAELPVMQTATDLANCLGLTIPQLRSLTHHKDVASKVHYTQFSVPKRSGGKRILSAPRYALAGVQRWIFSEILTRLPVEPCCHGFVPGRSIVTNARCHNNQAIVVNLDLEGYFPNITFPRVRRVFYRLGYSPAVASILALLCTECDRKPVQYSGRRYLVALGPRGLPQGACTSPALANQVTRRLDRRLSGLANRLGVRYTRYADDLTFSGDSTLDDRLGYLLRKVRTLAADEGFLINEKKTAIYRRNRAQMVTGLVVNQKVSLPRQEIRRLRAILHRARHEGLMAQNREGRPNFISWLRGKIAYVEMARPDIGAQLRREFNIVSRET